MRICRRSVISGVKGRGSWGCMRGEGRSRRWRVRLEGCISKVYFRYTAKSEGCANLSSDILCYIQS